MSEKEKETALARVGNRDEASIDVTGEALLKLVNLLYDTPVRLLPELTEIPRRAVLPLSIMMMRERAIDRPLDPETGKPIPLSRLQRTYYMQLMRSVGRRHFSLGATLAEGQLTKEEEKTGEEYELP